MLIIETKESVANCTRGNIEPQPVLYMYVIKTMNREPGMENGEQGTGNREWGTGNGEQGTGERSLG